MFSIRQEEVKSKLPSLEECETTLNRISGEVNTIASGTGIRTSAYRDVQRALRSYSITIRYEGRKMEQVKSTLRLVLATYEQAENNILGKVANTNMASVTWNQAVAPQGDTSSNGQKEQDSTGEDSADNNIFKKIWKYLGPLVTAVTGPVGTIIDAIDNQISANNYASVQDPKAIGKTGKVVSDLIKLAGGLVAKVDGTKIKWADWFGYVGNDGLSFKDTLINSLHGNTVSYSDSIGKSAGKYLDFSSVQKGFSTACNWAAAIVTSVFSNYQEHQNFGTRFWEETAVETGLKVLEGVAIGAIVGTAGAPAVIAAAAAVGLTVAVDTLANSAVRWVTKDPEATWMEAVSDMTCNFVEKEFNKKKESIQKIYNGISEGWNWFKNATQNKSGAKCKWGAFSFG